MRSFHAKEGSGEDSYCDTLGYTEAEVEVCVVPQVMQTLTRISCYDFSILKLSFYFLGNEIISVQEL